MATTATTTLEDRFELAVRAGNGIEVGLYWSKSTNRVTVEVFDQCLDEGFEFEVEGSHALDAFNHPYAYAAVHAVSRDRPLGSIPARESGGGEI